MAKSLSHALTAEDQARQSRHQIRKEFFCSAHMRLVGAADYRRIELAFAIGSDRFNPQTPAM